jgi:hypothetical protein
MALIDTYNLALNPDIKKRVAAACWKAATDINNEAVGTTNHANRVLWGKAVTKEDADGHMVCLMARNCSQNATIAASGAAATDNDIQFVVNSFINVFADGKYGS